MLQHLPQENLIQILSFLLVQQKYYSEEHLVELIEIFPSILFINKEIQQKIITSDYFIDFIDNLYLSISSGRVFRIYKYLNKITNNLIEIKNIVFNGDYYHKIKSIIKKFTTIKNCDIYLLNYLQSNIYLPKVENLTLNYCSYNINNLNSIKHFLSSLKLLKTIYLPIDFTNFSNELNEIIKLLNKVDIYLHVDIPKQLNLEKYLNEYKDFISHLICNDDLSIINIDLSFYKNLQQINFSNVGSDIILKELPYLSDINLFNCNRLIVSNCKNLKNLQIINVINCDINGENNHLNLLNLVNILNLNIKIDKINFLKFNSEIIFNLQMKINFIQLLSADYNFITGNKELLLKNNLNIYKILINDCNLNNNEVKLLQDFINNDNKFKNINFCLKNNNFETKLEIKDKKQFMESSQFFLIENKEDCFIINNINNYNIKTFTIMSTQNRNVKMVNFGSLLDLIVEATNISLDITELISLRSLTVLQENIINYNHLNLSKLIIKKNKNLNIKLNNLPNLKELEILGCKGINLELENKRMKLQIIKIEKLRNVNINLKLNCPELYKFYFSCYEIESDIINFEFYNTPILFIPKIEILQPENFFITSK
ncbi:hypothetical protein ABK040_016126 [Willaertia magna]